MNEKMRIIKTLIIFWLLAVTFKTVDALEILCPNNFVCEGPTVSSCVSPSPAVQYFTFYNPQDWMPKMVVYGKRAIYQEESHRLYCFYSHSLNSRSLFSIYNVVPMHPIFRDFSSNWRWHPADGGYWECPGANGVCPIEVE